MYEAGCMEIFPKNMAFDKLFPVCSFSWLFNSVVLITLEPQLIQVVSNLMFVPYIDDQMLAQVWGWSETFPHISHKKNKSLSASFGADIYTHELFSPFVLLSAVEKLLGLQGCGFGKKKFTTSSMSALVRPSPILRFQVYLQVVSTRKRFST